MSSILDSDVQNYGSSSDEFALYTDGWSAEDKKSIDKFLNLLSLYIH